MDFDVIVVGAGSSGATLAGRLAQAGRSVLLVEAGPDFRSIDAPAEMRQGYSLPLADMARFGRFWWSPPARMTAVQEPQGYERGRGMGGCSAVNVGVAIRGVPEDYDGWAAAGCTGWSYREVLPSFIRLESDADYGGAPYHGEQGPLPIERPNREGMGPVDRALADAATALGYGWAPDHNAPDATGVSPAAHNRRRGVRVTTADAYVEPARDSDRLTVRGDAVVDRVLFDGERARGVRALVHRDVTEFTAGEVILCAGAVHSPAILLRSGIGPAEHLRDHGVAVLLDVPVGSRANDHPAVSLRLQLAEQGGPVTDKYAVGCLARFSSGLAGSEVNDMGFGAFNVYPAERGPVRGAIFVTLFRAFSTGTVRLRSADPHEDPLIELNMLSDERDVIRMRDGVRRLRALAAQPALTSVAATLTLADLPIADLPGEAALDRWLLEQCGTIGHLCGSIPMGSPSDPHVVLDADCRVLGVEGLRVADASAMPHAPRANNHLSCVMLADHLAQRLTSGTVAEQ